MEWGSIYKCILCLGANCEALTLPKAPFTLPQTGLKPKATPVSWPFNADFGRDAPLCEMAEEELERFDFFTDEKPVMK